MAEGDERPQLFPQGSACERVQAGGWLVDEKHLRRGDQGDREVDPAPHPAGVGRDGLVCVGLEVELLEELCTPLAGVANTQPVQAPEHRQVGPAGEHLIDRGVLTHQSDVGPHVAALGGDVKPAHAGGARTRPRQSRQHLDQRGLSRPVGAQQRQHPPSLQFQVDPIDRCLLLPRKHLRQPHCFDDTHPDS